MGASHHFLRCDKKHQNSFTIMILFKFPPSKTHVHNLPACDSACLLSSNKFCVLY